MPDVPTLDHIPSEDPKQSKHPDSSAGALETSTLAPKGERQEVVERMEAFLGISPVDPDATVEQNRQTLNNPISVEKAGSSTFSAIPGYEIERELGRGGMGVVYLARHARLKRRVALKVMRGACAGADELDRFRAEAEAVAAFQHPNIVQVFEVGEYAGLPFFALEYVDGGSLSAQLGRKPISPAKAAALTETLARAIHHAHQKGIIHRDLKPANVLVTSDDVPKVTDFGLAKRLDEEESGLTQTGAVMGTPAYMAPEQAKGHTREAGPAADIYALGAMLYEFLTGKPPFVGTSTLDTIQKVLDEDPVPPSKLVTGIPRDLETICLKCLAKDPSGRYSSALSLAQDVERFRAGEPILGRREWIVRKVWRKVRKRAVVLVAGILVAVAAVFAVWATRDSGTTRRNAAISREFEEGLAAANWPEDRRDQLDQLADRLTTADPAQGEAARRKLVDRVAARVREVLRQPRVLPTDAANLETEVVWLEGRDPSLAAQIREELTRRLRDWQPRVELAAPFADTKAVFRPDTVSIGLDELRRKDLNGPILATLIPSRGQVRIAVEFGGDWEASRELGVCYHIPADRSVDGHQVGYGFVLAAMPAPARKELTPTALQTFRQTRRSAEVRLCRNGVVLQRKEVELSAGPIRILAERDGNRLRIQANDLAAVTFSDAVSLVGGDHGVIGLAWPAEAALTHLRVEESAVPQTASPLERADEMYELGKFADALPLYVGQARSEGATTAEARCKIGLCLVALNRLDDAIREFEAVMTAPGDQWPVVAAVQLWLIHLRAKQFQQAEALFTSTAIRFTPDQLAQYIPSGIREELGRNAKLPSINYWIPDPEVADRLAAAQRLSEFLQIKPYDPYALPMALALNRRYVQANEAINWLINKDLPRPGVAPGGIGAHWYWFNRLECWTLRAAGKRAEALQLARARVADYADHHWSDSAIAKQAQWSFCPFRLDLARCHAALGQWAEAEAAIDTFFRDYPPPFVDYRLYAKSRLIKGFLLSRRGDEKGAKDFWSKATYRKFVEQLPEALRPKEQMPSLGGGATENWLAASLSDTLADDDDAATIVREWLGSVSTDPLVASMVRSLRYPPAVIRGVWQSPRGREAARKLVFLDVEPADFFRLFPITVTYEQICREFFDLRPNEEQDELLWRTLTALVNLGCERKLTKTQIMQIGMAWNGMTGPLGWSGFAGALPPEVRGPTAYVFGRRYLKLGKIEDAKTLFRAALEGAPEKSSLRKLVEQEMVKLKK